MTHGLLGRREVGRDALSPRASFSSRGIAFSTVCRSARISSVEIVEMSSAGVDLAVDVGDVGVAEHPRHLADRRRLPDVGEELVAEALALGRAADDARDVHELHGRGQDLGRPEHLGEPRQPVVGYADHADVRLDGGERVVRREDVVLGQGVEERRLARVGESDDADGECHGPGVYGANAWDRTSRAPALAGANAGSPTPR